MEIRRTEKQLKEVEVTVEKYTECDKCKQKVVRRHSYDAFSCHINITTGDSFPESTHISEKTLDLCQTCSEDLITLLEKNGYRINDTDYD